MTVRRRRVNRRRNEWDWPAHLFVLKTPPPWVPMSRDDLADLEVLAELHEDKFRAGPFPMLEALIRTGRATEDEVDAYIALERASVADLLAGVVNSRDMRRFTALGAPASWARRKGRERSAGLEAWLSSTPATTEGNPR